MENVKWNYFQYRKNFGYPVYLRFKQDDLHPKFAHLVHEMGFQELTDTESKKISLTKPNTRILTIQCASARLQLQINGSDSLDKYGLESLSIQNGTPVYTFRKVGIMAIPLNKTLWDLAINHDISHTDQMVGMRVILVRFLSQSLAEQGVLAYWGTIKDENVVIMKQQQSFGEAVLIDLSKRVIFSNGGESRFGSSLKIIRKDKDVKTNQPINREELISFLSVSTCLLSFTGLTQSMKRAIYDLSAQATATYGTPDNSINL
ncbi:MAG TPA: hypothetical protein VNJ08_06705 [Bacteriovoracaceae bacterium]|nr:hypothetical protein [Bacteriovoracaceae bacterium]